MRSMLMTGLMLALTACGGGEEPANNSAAAAPKPTPTPGPMLGGVDLYKPIRVAGSGAGWAIYIAPGSITYSDAPNATARDFYPVSPKLAGDTASIETETPEGQPVTIALTAKPCTAGKDALPLTAEARIGARTLKGCAGQATREWVARRMAQIAAGEALANTQ